MSFLGGLAAKILLGIVAVPTLASAIFYGAKKYGGVSSTPNPELSEKVKKSMDGMQSDLDSFNPRNRSTSMESEHFSSNMHGSERRRTTSSFEEQHTRESSSYTVTTRE